MTGSSRMQLVCIARGSPGSRCSVPGRGIAMLMGLATFLLGQVLRSDDVTARTRLVPALQEGPQKLHSWGWT